MFVATTALTIFLHIHFSDFIKGNQILVKEYTTVELVCPLSLNQSENDSLSWYYEESTPIAIQHTVNPAFKFKYKINDASNEEKRSLTIFNYSKSDQGKYICEGIINGEHKSEIFTTSLCKNSSAGIQHQTNFLCSHAGVYEDAEKHYEKYEKYDKCLNSATLKLHISHQGILEEERKKNKHTILWKYMCLTSNEDQCTKSDLTFFIHVECQLQSDNLPRPVERTSSFQDENQNNDPVVLEYLEITESAHYQSAEFRNNASISTYSRNTSAHYQSIGSWNSNNETANELYNASDDSTNSIERSINAVVHQYVNTNISNTYEQLINPTNDFHTYEDVNAD
ncbi:unnamed protein product [Mytilus coruscus]|uniref:Ig-like domain-containing protein n=1 Tax=Mytilus coruscus TaxID=42192 RepID=A0A6J8E3L9_MYTCO|nr:unnamed protein product [Mytilus coruscus]